jgi:feruloyl esterase
VRSEYRDFAWRSVHELAVKAKMIIAAYYRRPAAYAYYAGSSTGGRDGLKSAQMFPHDFDGILAGTAIQDFTRGATQMLVTSQRLSAAGFRGSHGAALLALVHQSVVAAHDDAHGVAAKMTEAPGTRQWDPHSLVRRAGPDTSVWLSRAQADAVAASLAPLTDPVSREVLFVGQPLASQHDWINFILQPTYPLAVYRMGLNQADWDGSTFDLRENLPVVETRLGTINATDPDLRAFMAAGGKIIQYQPWDDGVAYPQSIVNYYNAVRDCTTHGSPTEQQSFYRLFMMPGVSHTGTGTEPFSFGHDALPPVSSDPEHDAVAALRAWVEKGIAPSKFIATKYVNDDPDQGVAIQRLLCPYPGKAVYRGAGDPNDPGNLTCKIPGPEGAQS